MSMADPTEGYDYGTYVKVYPIYTTEQSGTEETPICYYTAQTGAYDETTIWNNRWYTIIDDSAFYFDDESSVLYYIKQNDANLFGTTTYLYAYNPYEVAYNGNNATAGTMSGFLTRMDTSLDSTPLAAPNFYKTNYGFAGWSENQNATVNSNAKIYGPNEEIDSTSLNFNSSTHGDTLYAVWVPSAGNLQNWSGCSSLGQGQVTALTDTRDNQTYAVAKLADNKCWMIENLRLDAANSSDSTKAQGFGGVFTGLANPETSNFSNSTTANSKYSTSNITGSNQGYRYPRYNNSNTSSPVANMSTTDANIYSYGNYYTWAAAKANTTNITTQSASGSANTSICPAGWHLPTGGDNGEFSTLATATDNNPSIGWHKIRSFPSNFTYSGSIIGSSFSNRGSSGSYWSSTAFDGANNASRFTVSYFNAMISNYTVKYGGLSVRCVSNN